MRLMLKYLSYIGLGLTLIPSFLVYFGIITLEINKIIMLIGTIIWFVSAPSWMNRTS